MSVGYKTKRFVWNRDLGQCFYCDVKLTWQEKTVDHVIPKSKGGPHRAWNIVVCCQPCNKAKGDSDPTTEQMGVVLRWKIAHETRLSVEKALAFVRRREDQDEIIRLEKLKFSLLEIIHARKPTNICYSHLHMAA